jgi:hypothetical protein
MNFFKKIIFLIFILNNLNGTPPIIQQNISDDGFTVVPLQFGFPFYGKTFTHSVMYDNGVVGFFDPVANLGCNPATQWCGGQNWPSVNPSTSTGPAFNYMIAPLFADLAPNSQTRYLTQGDNTFQRYMWENIHEYYSGGSRLNTFGLEIFPNGDANTYYQNVNMMSSNIFIGSIGNASQGEWDKKAYYPANTVVNHVDDWSIIGSGPIDPCLTNPLSSISCPGYSTAYMAQQCTINPLYDSSCPGYPQAYYNQQCTLSALYDSGCPGYNEAYFYYVCTDNPLYDIGCPGYSVAYFNQQCSINPLYSTDCYGYAEAYFLQQCTLNPLYANTCPGYEVAYHDLQCELNPLYATSCIGYATAYYNQQCSLNPLYDIGCPGYSVAYHDLQCSLNTLYASDCPGYEVAYFNQQCSLSGLYSTLCPNYTTAYFDSQCLLNPLYSPACPGYAVAMASQITTLSTSETSVASTASTSPIVTEAPTTTVQATSVNTAETNPVAIATSSASTSTTSATSVTSPISVITPVKVTMQEIKPEPKPEAKKEEVKTEKKEDQKSINIAKVKEELTNKGKTLADDMSKAATLEAQQQVQNQVLGAMAYVPGSDTYYKSLYSVQPFYQQEAIYKYQKIQDSKNGKRNNFAQQILHQKMIDSQYSIQDISNNYK